MTRMPAATPTISSAAASGWSSGLPSCPQARDALMLAMDASTITAVERRWPWRVGPGQLPDTLEGWHAWLFLGGRGAGKTRAGAEWIAERARSGARLALVGPSLHDVREVMIDGPSGVRTILSGDERPRFEASRRRLVWSTGAEAYAFSAEDPESLRGPQFAAAWADEFCAWRRPGETLAMLRMGLRLGSAPQLVVTTTPKPIAALRRLLAEPGVAVTRAGTAANAANLSPGFVSGLAALYGGTRLEAQELHGLVVEDGAALWRAEDLSRARGARPQTLEAVVVAVDPPATAAGDACGIVAAGRAEGRAYVLEDASQGGLSPLAGRAAPRASPPAGGPRAWWPRPTRAARWCAPSSRRRSAPRR